MPEMQQFYLLTERSATRRSESPPSTRLARIVRKHCLPQKMHTCWYAVRAPRSLEQTQFQCALVLLVVTQVRNDGCGPVISDQIAVRNVGYPAALHSIHQVIPLTNDWSILGCKGARH